MSQASASACCFRPYARRRPTRLIVADGFSCRDMLHVIPDPLTMGWGTDEARLPRMLDEADDAVRARAEQLRTVQTGEVETRIAVDTGPPDDRIVQYADTRAIDLIVMVPRGRNAVEKAWIGSITDAVLRRAHCPVTVVPALP